MEIPSSNKIPTTCIEYIYKTISIFMIQLTTRVPIRSTSFERTWFLEMAIEFTNLTTLGAPFVL